MICLTLSGSMTEKIHIELKNAFSTHLVEALYAI